MPTNRTSQGLLAEDWDVTTASTDHPHTHAPPESQPGLITSNKLPSGLILPDSVALMLEPPCMATVRPTGRQRQMAAHAARI